MLLGEKVRLRAVEREDLPRYVTWLNDPEVREFLSFPGPISLASEEEWFESNLRRDLSARAMAITTEDGVHIGGCGFQEVNWQERSAELGIFIGDKNYWSRGYGGDAVRVLVRWGFETWNLHRIWLRVREDNRRAIRAYEKAGFVHEGRMRQAAYRHGRYYDWVLMSVIKPEYEQGLAPERHLWLDTQVAEGKV